MRFLNKVVFINSATIQYAEVLLDGNVHLIGTQGVGKSTLLRAILFFYNADTLKLGISKEKKNFAEYYLPYQNSFLLFEIQTESGAFCIMAFKNQAKVCFRFIDAAYQRPFFVREDGRAFDKWEETRQVLDLQKIDYSRKIDRYEEYRDILYGNIETGKKEFVKYALLQSKQYQNIPRTIQNVFLNSKLEAEFIKQTIIMSLNEEDLSIDLQSYTHHLKGFENQLNDIHLYKQPHIAMQADSVVKNHFAIKHLENEKNKFSLQLAYTAAQVYRSIPKLIDKREKKEAEKNTLIERLDATEVRHRNKIEKQKGEISVLESDIKKAKDKTDYYQALKIDAVIERVGQKNIIESDVEKLKKEKQLLTIEFGEVTAKYESLLNALDQSQTSFLQLKKEEQLHLKEEANLQKEELKNAFEKQKSDIQQHHEDAINQARLNVEQKQQHWQQEKLRKATVTHQRFFETEIDNTKDIIAQYQIAVKENVNEIDYLKNKLQNLQKQVELEEIEIKQKTNQAQGKLAHEIKLLETRETSISSNLANSEDALYGWLNTHKAGWENSIGRLVHEEVLFSKDMNPTLEENTSTLFGVSLDLDELPIKVKSLSQYQAELKQIKLDIETYQKSLVKIQQDELKGLDQIRKKIQSSLKETNDQLKQTAYKHEQDELQLKQATFNLTDFEIKAKAEKNRILTEADQAIGEAVECLIQAQQGLQKIEEERTKQIKQKEREITKKLLQIETQLKANLELIATAIKTQQQNFNIEKDQVKHLLQEELLGKGVNTDRLNQIQIQLDSLSQELKFIIDHHTLVIEYKKDKKELLDKADSYKTQKNNLEKQTQLEEEKYKLSKEKIVQEINEVDILINEIKQQLIQLETDSRAYGKFQQSDAFLSIHSAYTEEKELYKNTLTCQFLIDEIGRCYYSAIKRMDNLKESANKFLGNFSIDNIFKFNQKLSDNHSYQAFAEELNEFINNSKIEEFEKRVNERFANVISLVGKQTNDLMSKTGEIQKVISNINKDFDNKNFVGAIRKIELRIDDSANKVVQLLIQIKQYNDDHIFEIGGLNLFSSVDNESKNKKAVELLKQLSKSISEYKKDSIALSDSFELKFRIEENQNDTGWVEKLSNVGSEGTDVLVKAMINIMLLNVFKEGASKRFKEFRLHCMMDEIGKLHPNNIKGILQFANDRNILLINGSPTETNALNYKHIYKLEKDDKRNTKIKRIVSQLN